jgi:Arc/MetJ-type ribon-helix-helix transcriptional regulator
VSCGYLTRLVRIPKWYHIGMSIQIAVRLPNDLVEYVDSLVSDGAGSRATVVARALNLYQQQLRGEQDARILEEAGDYDDFDELVGHAVIED